MGQRQLASVLFAVLGVFLAASRLPEFAIHLAILAQPTSVSRVDPVSQRLLTGAALGATLLAVLIGTGLVLFRDRLASRLFPPSVGSAETPEIQAVALSVLGCYLAVQGLSRLLWSGRLDWGAATQLALGVALFVGARGLSRLWALTRSGHRAPNHAERGA